MVTLHLLTMLPSHVLYSHPHHSGHSHYTCCFCFLQLCDAYLHMLACCNCCVLEELPVHCSIGCLASVLVMHVPSRCLSGCMYSAGNHPGELPGFKHRDAPACGHFTPPTPPPPFMQVISLCIQITFHMLSARGTPPPLGPRFMQVISVCTYITFHMLSVQDKIDVNGENAHPVYKLMREKLPGSLPNTFSPFGIPLPGEKGKIEW